MESSYPDFGFKDTLGFELREGVINSEVIEDDNEEEGSGDGFIDPHGNKYTIWKYLLNNI